jgi:hypothetical protein
MNMNDSAVDQYLKTPWRTDAPTSEEVAKLNASIGLDMPGNHSMDVAPCIPAKSIENASFSDKATYPAAESSSTTMNWFPGWTWSWQYGPTDRHVEAPEVTRPMEGNWFPKTDYSRIIYQVNIQQGMQVYFRIDRGADTIARYVRLYAGSVKLLEDVIWSYQTSYSKYVTLSVAPGWYYVVLEINWGGYVDKGWCLRYWNVIKPDSEGYYQAVRTEYQQFRKVLSSELVFRAPMGPNTLLNIATLNCGDILPRYLYVYVDGAGPVQTLYSPGNYCVPIFDYFVPGMHELKLVLYYGNGGWGEYPKSISQLYVSYDFMHVESDYMAGYYQGTYYNHSQPQAVYDYLQAYYRTHDYRRVQFQAGDCVGFEYQLPVDVDYINQHYYSVHFQHIGQDRWTYGLFGHYIASGVWGYVDSAPGHWFVIGDESSYYLLDYRKWILTHEHGHVEGMLDASGYKTDVYFTIDQRDWTTPHYAASSWTTHLTWVVGWW